MILLESVAILKGSSQMEALAKLISELKRRNVLKVVTAYAVAGFIVLQLCDIVFPALGLEDAVIGYVLIGLIALLPIVTVLTWLFEITPDGLRRTREVDSTESISQFTGQRINHIIIVLLSVATAFFAWEYFNKPVIETDSTATPAGEQELVIQVEPTIGIEEIVPSPSNPLDARPSIAVLPFMNMSSSKENGHFSDGLSEEILNLLAQSPDLRVAGRTSSFFYKDKNENLTIIGETLNVDHILEGSVRKSGNKVRITAQLISAADGFHLWSKTYDRELADIFAVQDEIAGEVTRAMEVTLLSDGILISDRATTNPETYDLYLRAKNALYDRGQDNVRLSTDLFKQAIALDPEYAPAYVDLAVAELLLNWNYGIRTTDEALANANEALQKARQLDHLTSDYYAVLGLYHSNATAIDSSHLPDAEAAFEKAIQLNPNNVRAYMWWSTALSTDSRYDDRRQRSLTLNNQARALDPLNRIANGNHAGLLAAVGKIDEAIADLDRLVRVDPEYGFYHAARTNLYLSIYDYIGAAESLATTPTNLLQYPFLARTIFSAFDDLPAFIDSIDAIPSENPSFDFILLLEMSQSATLAELRAEADVLLLKPDPDFFAVGILFKLLEYRDYELVRQLVENARVDFQREIPSLAGTNGFDPRWIYLASIYKAGQVERAKIYAEKLLETNESAPFIGAGGKGITRGNSYLVIGDKEKALTELEQAFDAGWLGYYNELANDPLWQEIIDEPRVMRVKERIDQRLEQQRPQVYRSLHEQGLVSSL